MSGAPPPAIRDPAQSAAAHEGLSSEEARQRLETFGPNDPVRVKRGTAIYELLTLFLNPLVIILLLASLISFVLGNTTDASIILVVVLLGIFLNFAQTYKSHRAIQKLREHVAPTACVLRDAEWREIKRNEVVPGDLVRLSAGDLIPADGRLLVSRDLYVQEAALTGESLPVEKDSVVRAGQPTEGPEAPNLVFLGTSVVSGTATVQITATGPRTAFGVIAERLAARVKETEFESSMKRFSLLILRAVFFLVLFILAARVALHKDAFESFVFAVALAVGLTPEFLPMITSVTLARGAVRMAREQVIVKHLPAIQNFGTIDMFCTDKTGTLTTGEIELHASMDYAGKPSDRALFLAYLNSKFETGIRSPLDVAILKKDLAHAQEFVKCDEIPFDFDRRRLSIVMQKSNARGNWQLISKGAPEGILDLSDSLESEGKVIPLDSAARQQCQDTFHQMSSQGFRLLGVAYRELAQLTSFSAADEHSLVFAGFLAFADPAHPDAAASLAAMKRDGVRVKVLTGDNELVACHICQQVGLETGEIVLGDELNLTSDTALQHMVEQCTVFARVSPMQKLRIINALRSRGHVVGYMGDGINDAPSLRAADVGISVASAADVARDAAEIILLKQGLSILHKGIIEGRRASANVLKYILMGTSSNFGNMFSMAGASMFLQFLPMLPTQILLNNFLYDLSQVTIPSDKVDKEYIRRPRRWDMKLVRNFMIFIGPISSLYDFLTFFVLLYVFHAGQREFHTGWFIESLATQTLVIFVIRTARNPLKSRPSLPLTLTTLLIVAFGVSLSYLPIASMLGFTPLPGPFYVFLAVSIVTYLILVEIGKRILFRSSPVS